MPAKLNAAPLRAKGYLPLPVEKGQKGCLVSGWPTMEWEGEADNIGLNLDGLVLFDVDLDVPTPITEDDPDPAMALVACLPKGAPIRMRHNSSRIAVLVRCPELSTGVRLRRKGAQFSAGHVEVKGGRGHFMLGWGRHPSGGRLVWDLPKVEVGVSSPGGFLPKKKLPAMSLEEVDAAAQAMDAALEGMFGPPLAPARSRHSEGFASVFDLRWDSVFSLPDGSEATLEALYEGPETNRFVNCTPWRPDSDSGAGHLVHSTTFDGPVVVDFVASEVHFLDPIVDGGLDKDVELPRVIDPIITHEAIVAREAEQLNIDPKGLDRLVYVREDAKWAWVDDPDASLMTMGAAFYEVPVKKRNKAASKVSQIVQRQVWDPRKRPLAVVENPERGWLEHNLFHVPAHPETGGTVEPFLRFLERFIPDDDERDTILQWLAHKVKKPYWRSFAPVFVGPQGSGKGSLWQIIGDLWGPFNVSNLSNIAGVMHAQYQDALYKKLWVLIDEVSGEEAGSEWEQKKKAADRLKGFIEPHPSHKQLNLKGKRYVDALVCATVGIASNHEDAIPFDRDDRRFFVVSTGPTLAPHEAQAIHNWRADPKNIGALWRLLRDRVDLGGFNPSVPPMTEGKRRMAAANVSEVEEAVDTFRRLVEETGGVWTKGQQALFAAGYGMFGPRGTSFNRLVRRGSETWTFRVDGKSFRARSWDPSFTACSGTEVSERIAKLDAALAAGPLENL